MTNKAGSKGLITFNLRHFEKMGYGHQVEGERVI